MPLITETYYLSLTQDNRGILRLRCSQDDTLRTVNLKLYNNGSIFVIPSGVSASISGVKQNGAVFSKPCTISQNRESVVLQLSSDITNVDGIIVAEIVLNDGEGGRLGTSNFIIQVEKNPIRAGVVQDTETPIEYINDFITQIQALTARVNNLITPNGDPSLAEVVDARISSLDGNTYQNLKARIDADIAALNTRKANKADVYTKAQVDTLLDNVEIDVDDEFSDESENPVQNKVVAGAISEIKADLADIDSIVEDELQPAIDDVTQIKTALPKKVNQPVNGNNQPINGTSGQVLRTNGDGSTEWASVGLPTDAQTEQAVSAWLDAHPDATTTVTDGAITEPKVAGALLKNIKNGYITPKTFGAVGDGVTDDTAAFTSFINADGSKFVPAGDYLVSGTVRHYGRGVFGNGDWDNSLLPAYSVWFPNGANPNSSIVFNSGEKNLTNNEMASIVLQEVVHYEDDDSTPNENFTRTTGLLYTGTYEGYTENSAEAITQNFAGIQSIVRNNFGGILGTSAIQGRLYIPEANEAIQQYGGNKGVAVGGGTFTSLHCSHGGYAYGAELDCYDNCNEGTFPTYKPGDNLYDTNSPRVTASLVLSVSGKKQPVTACLITNGAGNTGAWNGIYLGGSTFGMDGQYGVDGTVGINFAGWQKNGRYAHTAIRFGYAVRHIVARDDLKVNSSNTYILPHNDEDNAFYLMRNKTNDRVASLVWGSNVDVEADEEMTNLAEDARLLFSNSAWQFKFRTKANIVLVPNYSGVEQGYVVNKNFFRPTWDGKPSLGDATRPFGTLFAGDINLTGGSGRVNGNDHIYVDSPIIDIGRSIGGTEAGEGNVELRLNRLNNNNVAKLSFGIGTDVSDSPDDTGYTEEALISYVKSAARLQITSLDAIFLQVNRRNESMQGYVINGTQFRPAHTTNPSLGDSTRKWGTAYINTLNLNGVTLDSTQLTQLLALLN